MTMAAICCSHSPLMLGFYEPADRSAESAVRESFARMRQWIDEYVPDIIAVFGPDHYNGFFYELMPAFCLGAQAEGMFDWDIRPGRLNVPQRTALDCLAAVRAAEIDIAFSWKMSVDHGTTIPLNYLTGGLDRYPVLPIVINCVAPPLPSFRRCRMLGDAVGRFLRTLDARVLVIGSGGLSHDPPTPRLDELRPEEAHTLIDRRRPTKEEYDKRQARVISCTRQMIAGVGPCLPPDPEWDLAVLERFLTGDLGWFDALDDSEVARVGGHGAHEVRCWLAAMAAMGEYSAVVDCYRTIPEWMTGMGLMRALPASG